MLNSIRNNRLRKDQHLMSEKQFLVSSKQWAWEGGADVQKNKLIPFLF
jgi:hypothetical protein